MESLIFAARIARGASAVLCGMVLAWLDAGAISDGAPAWFGAFIMAMCVGCGCSGAIDLSGTIFDALKEPEPGPMDVRGMGSTLLNDWTPYLRGERNER